MKDAPALTIITVCRNEPNIERTCESIVSQTWQDFEWIVVDGASTDGTLDILEKYKDRIDVFVSEPDTGIFNAMNKGIRLAHGEFLNFMNGGDEFVSPRTLETVFSGTTKQYRGYGVVFGDAITEKDGRRNLVSFPRERAITRLVVEGFSINHQAAFIRRDLFQKFGPYDESFRIIADFKKFLVLIKNGVLAGQAPSFEQGMILLCACLPVGIVGLLSAIHQGRVAAAGMQMMAKQKDKFAMGITYSAMVETYAILALLISALIILMV